MTKTLPLAASLLLAATVHAQPATNTGAPLMVTIDNFIRAESGRYFTAVVKKDGFGQFEFVREPAPVSQQSVIRMNRDTLYGAAVFDLDAGPVTVTLPDPGSRYMSMQLISEDQYSQPALRAPGRYTITREQIGTRYVAVAVRILVDANDPADIRVGNALQDAIRANQGARGNFEVPRWDPQSQRKVRDALLVLGATLPDSRRMFGTASQVDPVRRLVGAATLWGGFPEEEALYLNFAPPGNDAKTVYRLDIGDVPVDGFWSISVYNTKGYFEPNERNAYAVNNISAKKGPGGRVSVQFGGCTDDTPNCLPTTEGWNYTVRLYRPRAEALSGKWSFPLPTSVN